LIRALNVVFEVDENRNYFQLRLTGFLYTLILIITIVLFLFLPVVGSRVLMYFNQFIKMPELYIILYSYLRWVIITVFFFFGILTIYTKVPNRKGSLKHAIWGSMFALLGWLANSIGYSFIITNFSRISFIYGGISAVLLLSFWLYIDSIIILTGAEIINYQDEKNPA
jgi:membrane protein